VPTSCRSIARAPLLEVLDQRRPCGIGKTFAGALIAACTTYHQKQKKYVLGRAAGLCH
jgi:hypothetical protein